MDNPNKTNQEEVKEQSAPVKGLLRKLDVSGKLNYDKIIRNMPFVLFLAGLALFHIANNHYAENDIRQISRVERDLKALRWEYMTGKSELMFSSKQSEVAKMVVEQGMYELTSPPMKIVVDKNEY